MSWANDTTGSTTATRPASPLAVPPVMGGDPAAVTAEHLAAARRDLLDLGVNRNALLNFRPSRTWTIELSGEKSGDLWAQLFDNEATCTFQAEETAARSGDRALGTRLAAPVLAQRLRAIAEQAASHIEEQGVNVHHLALGFLHWRDAEGAERRAPLVLMPVALERTGVKARYVLRHAGEDPADNLCLREKLRVEEGIDLDGFAAMDPVDLDAWGDLVGSKVAHLPGWSVAINEQALGFFAFGKFLMWQDLDPARWPQDRQPHHHALLSGVLAGGLAAPAPIVPADADLDVVRKHHPAIEVLDADSSQAAVLHEIARGRSLVIQGPPGTGKSQTIANAIAQAVASGKTVLFVAEKMAALDVVKRRLDDLGLGGAVLELHSHKAGKRAVLDQLRRTLDLGEPVFADLEKPASDGAVARDRLNAYAQALHEPVKQGEAGSPFGPYQLLGEMVAIDARGRPPDIADGEWQKLSAGSFAEACTLVDDMQGVLSRIGLPAGHPFTGAPIDTISPGEQELLATRLGTVSASLATLTSAVNDVAAVLGVPTGKGLGGARRLLAAAALAVQAPARLAEAAASHPDWTRDADAAKQIAGEGVVLLELKQRHGAQVVPEAWTTDLGAARHTIASYGDSWLRFFNPAYLQARRQLRGMCVGGILPDSHRDRVALVEATERVRKISIEIAKREATSQAMFGSLWKGIDSDFPALAAIAQWCGAVHAAVAKGELPKELLAKAGTWDGAVVAAARDRLAAAVESVSRPLAEISAQLRWQGSSFEKEPLAALAGRFDRWRANLGTIDDHCRWQRLTGQIRNLGLGPLLTVAESWDESATRLGDCLRRAWCGHWLEVAWRTRQALASFAPSEHEAMLDRFRNGEAAALALGRARTALAHWQRLPGTGLGLGQVGLLRRECEKKSRHLAIRQLLAQAPQAVQAACPVFMMSPLSVAAHLAPHGPIFDLVLFDEASQVRPVDAFGAIARAGQAVVVGDSRQMPPTTFFDRLSGGDADDADEDANVAPNAGVESILALLRGRGLPERTLNWHYRSRHPSLIAVSNAEFYDRRLVVPPSPLVTSSSLGLQLVHLPATIYERGGSRTNPKEAIAVAEAVLHHARTTPQLSLGVVAFSIAQKRAIEDELARLRSAARPEPTAVVPEDGFFAAHPSEPFFVKNLENVQGDERDAILISVGYGRDTEGKVALNFGPLTAAGGERRLNVLISRARVRCAVYTNLVADDLDLGRTDSQGVAAFKRFLAYGASLGRPLPADVEASASAADPLLEEVAESLAARGWVAARGVGDASLPVDLAVRDRTDPSRHVLAVLVDGERWRAARWARDRDRLRPALLERLGWKVHRLWSAAWRRDAQRELERLINSLEPNRRGAVPPVTASSAGPVPAWKRRNPAGASAPVLPAYQEATVDVAVEGELRDASPESVASHLSAIVAQEAPIHHDELHRRFLGLAASKNGSRIQLAIDAGLDHAVAQQQFERRGDFLWKLGQSVVAPRQRASGKRSDLVAPEEFAEAAVVAIRAALGLTKADAIRAGCRLMGFTQVPDEVQAEIATALDRLVGSGRIVLVGEELRAAAG